MRGTRWNTENSQPRTLPSRGITLTSLYALLLLLPLAGALNRFPAPDWPIGAPEEHGLSSAKLQDAARYAGEQKSGCFAVIADGVLVKEAYYTAKTLGPLEPNAPPSMPELWNATTTSNIHSSTKSVMAALVGIAQDLGLLKVTDPAYQYGIRSWAPPSNRSRIAVRDFLSMDSGLHWEIMEDYFQGMFLAKDKTAFGEALNLDHKPGEWWDYNNMAVQTLEAILRNSTGLPVDAFAQQHLFSKIGLGYPHSTVNWYKDKAGNTLAFDGIQLGCRALARMGHLWLNNGSWAGHQVVSKDYVLESVRSTELNAGYGYLWWLGHWGHWVLPAMGVGQARLEGDGTIPMFPDGDNDTFAMLGGQGQVAIIEPRRNVVIVRQGEAPPAGDMVFGKELVLKVHAAYRPTPAMSSSAHPKPPSTNSSSGSGQGNHSGTTSSGGGLNGGAIAGIVIVVIAVVGIVGGVCYCRRSQKKDGEYHLAA